MLRTKLDDEIDSLFTLPLAEFTGARNALASQLKKDGRQNDADRVKLLGKPPISAWAVNQLYWDHREAFDQLIATSKRFHMSRLAGKVTAMRESLDARREALAQLSDMATTLLRDAGHNPTLDTIRRISATLEALSTYALLPDGPNPGHLTEDVDPPSLESLALLMSGASPIQKREEPARGKPRGAAPSTLQKPAPIVDMRQIRQAKIAGAKASLQDAKKSLTEARARAQSLEVKQKEANADVKEAEKFRREAEERLKKATSASEDAARRAHGVAAEAEEAAQALEGAKRTVEKATKELESSLRESPAR